MTDAQVELFVARYMPAYELFGQDIAAGDGTTKPRWAANHLVLTLNHERNITKVDKTQSDVPDDVVGGEDMPVDNAAS